ncbi:MAG: hypothetical protein GY779_13055 [Gammaproteobacteria bacterium]|nr:hypothetical protein [Gammaproteobacteria bacterium]
MKWITLLFMTLLLSLPASANHDWTTIDLCEIYKDKLPPGLTHESLPEAHSHGAVLLNQYCTQCHNLPGPDRHTAAEWSEVAAKMFMLMEVSNRFGGLMGQVENMRPQDQQGLIIYLQRHASKSTIINKPVESESNNQPWLTRSLTLMPFFLLAGLGLLRWWQNSGSRHKSCITE